MKGSPLKFFEKYDITPRLQQLEVLAKVQEHWDDYNFFALSLPVGVGKTYVATSIANAIKNSYIITSTIQLQDQYEESWAELKSVKGKSNYTCQINQNSNVENSMCRYNKKVIEQCISARTCDYYNALNDALESEDMITNPMFLLYSTYKADLEESKWKVREALIIDEAQNIESHLISFSQCTIDATYYKDELDITIDEQFIVNEDDNNARMISGILDKLVVRLESVELLLEGRVPHTENASVSDWIQVAAELSGSLAEMKNKANKLQQEIKSLEVFLETYQFGNNQRWLMTADQFENKIKLTPIYGDFLFMTYFGKLAKKFIFLSATLGDKKSFSKEIGVSEDKLFFMETDSPFPAEKSPIISLSSINLTHRYFDQNINKLGAQIDSIFDMYPNQRGIVHSGTYKIQKEIWHQVTPVNRERLLCRDMHKYADESGMMFSKGFSNVELINMHSNRTFHNSVLLSPSMLEGVDLYDDLAAFQIIVKMPWLNLGDDRIKFKSQLDPDWYTNKMWMSIMQASGRSTRHENDGSHTFILDSGFNWAWGKWKSRLPSWFNSRVTIL